jgi:hypothetical protein
MSKYPSSKWYRTGNMRIVPWYFGLMRAEEEFTRDCYDPFGETNGTQSCWKGVGKLPNDRDGPNLYSTMAATKENNPWLYKWNILIQWLGDMGIKDTPPASPAQTQRNLRRWERETLEKIRLEDEAIERGDYQ